MKKVINGVLVLFLVISSTVRCDAMDVREVSNANHVIDNFTIAENLNITQTLQVESDVEILSEYFNTSNIKSIECTSDGNEYLMDYDGVEETIQIKAIDEESVTIEANDGQKTNEIVINENGKLFIDGFEIKVTNTEITDSLNKNSRATVWKGVKSLKPYGSKKASDYNKELTHGQQNAQLGQALNNMTITALSQVLKNFVGLVDIPDSIDALTSSVRNVLVAYNSTTKNISYTYYTYTSGAYDYKYVNKYYPSLSCSGGYATNNTYEHFTVY